MLKSINLKSDLIRNIMVLTSGTAIAQVVAYVLTPIITRLYTPAESAELGLYLRIIGVGAALATARYELALPVAKLDQHSFRIYRFALRVTFWVTVISLVAVFVPMMFSKSASMLIFYLAIPLGIGLSALTNLGTNWSIRMKQFSRITYSRLTNSVVSNLAKVGFGLLKIGYIGLILGTLLGFVLSIIFFVKDFRKTKKKYGIQNNSPRNYLLAKEYLEFPKVNLPHTLMDLGKDLVIAAVIWELFSQNEYGLYNHTIQMLRIPLVLFGTSIGQVFFQRCAEKINKGQNVTDVAVKSVKTLLYISIVPFGIVFFFGSELFEIVFGPSWKESGVYAEIMVPWFMVNFLASPISTLPLILKKQRPFFVIALIDTILMIATLTIPKMFFNVGIIETLWLTSIVQAIFLLIVIFIIFDWARKWKKS